MVHSNISTIRDSQSAQWNKQRHSWHAHITRDGFVMTTFIQWPLDTTNWQNRSKHERTNSIHFGSTSSHKFARNPSYPYYSRIQLYVLAIIHLYQYHYKQLEFTVDIIHNMFKNRFSRKWVLFLKSHLFTISHTIYG